MTDCVLGLDTSCYTTSVSAVTDAGKVICSCRRILTVPKGQKGLRQSEALFQHVRNLPDLIRECCSSISGMHIAAVCASVSPRDYEESYMPVFLAGRNLGESLAAVLDVPFFTTSHQRGHIAAARVESGAEDGDILAVHLSGGTTEVLAMKNDVLTLVGGSRDLHAGQMIDRVGVRLGMEFPAGKYLEQLALSGSSRHLLPVSMERGTGFCHMSGAETQSQKWIDAGEMKPEDIAAEVFDFVGRTVAKMLTFAAKETGITQGLVAGGVACSALIRQIITSRLALAMPDFRVYFGKPEFSGDNAVGTALIGAEKYRLQGENSHGSENS